MSKLIVLVSCFAAAANAFSLVSTPRKPFRAAITEVNMEVTGDYNLAAYREYEECVVDAESAAELESCGDMQAEPAPSARGEDFMSQVGSFVSRLTPKQPADFDAVECLVDAESAAEIAACKDP